MRFLKNLNCKCFRAGSRDISTIFTKLGVRDIDRKKKRERKKGRESICSFITDKHGLLLI